MQDDLREVVKEAAQISVVGQIGMRQLEHELGADRGCKRLFP